MSKTTTKSKASNGSAGKGLQGRRFTSKQKEAALALVAAGVLPRASIAELMGTTPESVRRWVREAEAKGSEDAEPSSSGTEEIAQAATVAASAGNNGASGKVAQSGKRSLYAPKDPGQGLGEYEVAAILELKKKHPSMGPAQLRAQLKRFKGWRLSNKAIARVLRREGYQLVHGAGRPEGPEPIRFEAPRRNALWQADYTDVRVGSAPPVTPVDPRS